MARIKNELAEDTYFFLVPFVSKRRRLFRFLEEKKTPPTFCFTYALWHACLFFIFRSAFCIFVGIKENMKEQSVSD